MIKIENLVKSYNGKKLFDKINLNIPDNKIIGLIGANGSGKTTLLEICMGIKKFDEGSIFINDFDLSKGIKNEYKKRIGVVFQDSSLYGNLKVREILDLFKSYYDGVDCYEVDELIELFQLEKYSKKLYRSLSGGWKQRVLLAAALINKPEVVFLDEPTTGLDPKARKILWDNIKEYKGNNNCTVFLSSHYMDEVQENCDFLVSINNGVVLDSDYVEKVIDKHNVETLNEYYLKI